MKSASSLTGKTVPLLSETDGYKLEDCSKLVDWRQRMHVYQKVKRRMLLLSSAFTSRMSSAIR